MVQCRWMEKQVPTSQRIPDSVGWLLFGTPDAKNLCHVTQEKYLEKGKWDAWKRQSQAETCRCANFSKKKRWWHCPDPPVIWYGTVKFMCCKPNNHSRFKGTNPSTNLTALCRASIEYHSAPSGDSAKFSHSATSIWWPLSSFKKHMVFHAKTTTCYSWTIRWRKH